MFAVMRPMVTRPWPSAAAGSPSVMSLSVSLGDGHSATLLAPAIVIRLPVARSTRAEIAEVRKPAGIPNASSNAAIAIMTATTEAAILKAFMTAFRPGQAVSIATTADTDRGVTPPGKAQAARRRIDPRRLQSYMSHDTLEATI